MNKILVVEDHADQRSLLRDALEHYGYQCDTAEHGAAALEKLEETPFSLILTDLEMPVMNGLQLIDALPAHVNGLLPVILLSAAPDAEVRCRARSNAVQYVFSKPYDMHRLLNAVEEVIRQGTSCSK